MSLDEYCTLTLWSTGAIEKLGKFTYDSQGKEFNNDLTLREFLNSRLYDYSVFQTRRQLCICAYWLLFSPASRTAAHFQALFSSLVSLQLSYTVEQTLSRFFHFFFLNISVFLLLQTFGVWERWSSQYSPRIHTDLYLPSRCCCPIWRVNHAFCASCPQYLDRQTIMCNFSVYTSQKKRFEHSSTTIYTTMETGWKISAIRWGYSRRRSVHPAPLPFIA